MRDKGWIQEKHGPTLLFSITPHLLECPGRPPSFSAISSALPDAAPPHIPDMTTMDTADTPAKMATVLPSAAA
jgi:hypothetical protein